MIRVPATSVGSLKTIYLGLVGFRRPTAASLARLRRYTGHGHGLIPITEQAAELVRAHLGDGERLAPYRGRVEHDLMTAPHLLRGIRHAFAAAGLHAEEDLAALEMQVAGWASFLRDEVLPRARDLDADDPRSHARPRYALRFRVG